MFRDHWIVADMDGTLTPTPTRAHGKYLSLSYCMQTGLGCGARYRSCLPWLRLFLERGGSVCVVSTAGKRMWSQLYPDLAPALFSLGKSVSASAAAPGTLFICGFTGAALFRTRPVAAVWADMDRLHPKWRSAAPSTAALASATSQETMSPVAASSAADDTTAEGFTIPPPSIGLEEWVEYREQGVRPLDESAVDGTPAAVSSCSSSPPAAPRSTTMSAEVHRLASREGRNAIIRFFEHASYVSGHDVKRGAAFFAECLSTKYHAVFTDILRQLLAEVGKPSSPSGHAEAVEHVCFAQSKVLSREALATHGFFLKETNDALVDAQQLPLADGTIPDGAAVAQVVVMGIPMRYCDAVFPPTSEDDRKGAAPARHAWQCCPQCAEAGAGAKARLEEAKLELKSQPNSVCLHQRGVDKATCVRWLQAQNAEQRLTFDLAKAVAFGDVPESVDRPLTEFPPMQFISVSPKAGAAEQLAKMSPTASSSLYHVGGEEEGTSLFLEELLSSCAKEAEQGSEPHLSLSSWFTPERVGACAARARTRMEAELAERREAEAGKAAAPRPTL